MQILEVNFNERKGNVLLVSLLNSNDFYEIFIVSYMLFYRVDIYDIYLVFRAAFDKKI